MTLGRSLSLSLVWRLDEFDNMCHSFEHGVDSADPCQAALDRAPREFSILAAWHTCDVLYYPLELKVLWCFSVRAQRANHGSGGGLVS